MARWEPSDAFRGQLVRALPVILSLTLAVLVGIFHFMQRISNLQRNLMAQEADMRHMALHDALTGLPNRANFVRQARAAIAGASAQAPVYIGLFDLDRFKLVNDTFGHDVGDRLIIETARRASQALGPENLLARLGGDEYALVLRSATGDSEALAQMKDVGAAIAKDFDAGQAVIPPSASIGLSCVDRPDIQLDEALKMADLALYEVKSSGRGHVRLFHDRRSQRRNDGENQPARAKS